MMNGPEKSDPAIVAMKPTKAARTVLCGGRAVKRASLPLPALTVVTGTQNQLRRR